MKKYFNKSIFKDKSFIKMICFTIVLLLVLILGNTFGYVSADGSHYLLNTVDYESSSLYESSFYNPLFGGNQSTNSSICYNFFSSELDFSNMSTPSSFDVSSIQNFMVIGGSYASDATVFLFDDDAFMYASETPNYFYFFTKSNHFFTFKVSYYGDGTNLMSMDIIPNSFEVHNLESQYIDDDFSLYWILIPKDSGWFSGTNAPIYGNMNYYNFDLSVQNANRFVTLMNYIKDGSNSNLVKNCNYLASQSNLNGFPNTGSGSESGRGPSNNMYADSADWVLNNYSGNVWSNYNTWSVTFTSNLNQYIRDEVGNLSESELSKYYLDFDCYAYVEFYYQGVGQDVSVQSPLYGNVQFTSTTTIPGDGYYWSCTYNTPTDSHANLFKNINAKSFADGGYSKTYSLYTLFKYLSPNGTFGRNPISITLSDLCDCTSSGDLLFDEIKNDWKKFNLVCTAKIYYKNGSEEYESGSYTENFDLLTGESSIGDSSMLTNYNPYNDNSDEQVQLPSTSGGTSTSSASTGNVTQTVTVTNDGAQYIPSLISKLIPTSLSDTGTGLVDSFSTMAQTNGFISVMASTVPAIPSTVWTYLTNYLGISLYLLACAFVLRLILDLL